MKAPTFPKPLKGQKVLMIPGLGPVSYSSKSGPVVVTASTPSAPPKPARSRGKKIKDSPAVSSLLEGLLGKPSNVV